MIFAHTWSLKARGLLTEQYAPVAGAAERGLTLALAALGAAQKRGSGVAELAERFGTRRGEVRSYAEAYRRYVWPVEGVQDVKLAPFQLLATAKTVYFNKPHVWHLEVVGRYLGGAPSFAGTALRAVNLGADLKDGVLALNPVSFAFNRGELNGTARINATRDTPYSNVDFRLSGYPLDQPIEDVLDHLVVLPRRIVQELQNWQLTPILYLAEKARSILKRDVILLMQDQLVSDL